MALPEGLLSAARNYLDITWEDDAGDHKITGILERGIQELNNIAGIELDVASETVERQLLLDYCRYARSNALDEFRRNYKSELVMLRIRHQVRRMDDANI